ncbi:glycosyltransferase family 2 protein [Kluyvera sp. EC_51]|uniref:glycosyltransferase family 2 protein n=1 Tax=Kluyvera sp. EC_51 TaxID=2584089 RepID=UPI001C6FD2D3|nr:glycosyltransferase family 2 protein [Kluyvera sp. EC_51]MBW9464179.1 glycosyltransferase family 2 protein [Kluyvera sp. EC_51]
MKTAVCAICRNEFPYIFEWIAYQKKLGFDEVFIYDNNSDDGTSELLIKLDYAGIINRVFWPRLDTIAPQRSAYADFLEKYAARFDWAFICDLDEFLYTDFGNVKDFIRSALNKEPAAAAIAVPWLMFGSSGNEEFVDELVTYRFTYSDDNVTSRVKSLFKPSAVYQIRTHIVDLHTGIYLDNDFNEAKWNGPMPICLNNPSRGYARVHHYFTKSKSEWIKRKSQAKADRAHVEYADIQLFEKYNNQTTCNYDLFKLSGEVKLNVDDMKERFFLKGGVSGNIIFSNNTLIIFRIKSAFEIKTIRVVIDNQIEILSSNLVPLHDGSVAFFLNIKTKNNIQSDISISSVDGADRLIFKLDDYPTRIDMLKNVINYIPNAEYVKFNIFKRLANDPKRSKHLTKVDFGKFSKFSEYNGMIKLYLLYSNSSLTKNDVTKFLGNNHGAAKKIMEEFLDSQGPFSDVLRELVDIK